MKENKFVAQSFVPKTETRIVLENKEPTRLAKFANHLGISKTHCCDGKSCCCSNNKTDTNLSITISPNTTSEIVFTESALCKIVTAIGTSQRTAEKYGGKTEVNINDDGSMGIKYVSPKK